LEVKFKQNAADLIDLFDNITPNIDISIILENFHIDIVKKQFDTVILILNHITQYQHFQAAYYETRKFKFYRPKEELVKNLNLEIDADKVELKEDKENRRKTIREWWVYSIKSVIKKMRYSRGRYSY